ncbi:uncharacterized protein LOC119839284 [Zerene cesonia]|uniref:uncharacterized protein LOC119839284 n=1 Tax=Zerene cesonia TaxID=33412 RepID=UPI0018E512BE|nr:uncharacterized protein LOC119839284 [Zerene cesonia]
MNSSTTSYDRKMRYRVILQDLSLEQENDNNDQRMQKTTEAVHEVKKLLKQGGVEERVRHPGESYLDSRVLRAASDLAISCSEAVTGLENTYNKHELAQHIRENAAFWSLCLPREVCACASLHGAFAPAPPAPRARERQRRAPARPDAQLCAPDSVERLSDATIDPEYGIPFVEPVPQTVQADDDSDENQFIVSMNMERWRDLIEAFEITEPMMVLKRL